MTGSSFIIIALVVNGAAILKSITGFGTSLILMPVFLLFFNIKDAALITALVDLTSNILLAYRDSSHFSLKRLKEISIGLFVGTFAGTILLRIVDATLMKIILGGLILSYIALNQINPKIEIRNEKAKKIWGYILGLIGGIFGGMFNTNGPAIFVYVKSVFPKKETVRANLIFLFLIDSIWRVSLHFIGGQYTLEHLGVFGFVLLPSLLLGVYAGTNIDKKLKSKDYSNVSKVILAISGIKLLLS